MLRVVTRVAIARPTAVVPGCSRLYSDAAPKETTKEAAPKKTTKSAAKAQSGDGSELLPPVVKDYEEAMTVFGLPPKADYFYEKQGFQWPKEGHKDHH